MISGSNFLATTVARGLFGLNQSNSNIATATARLASGNRLQRAGDDVAALSIAARMGSQLSTLRQAQQNAIQGDSMLQVASGGASQIYDILDRMNALSVQAGSGALTASDRALLNTEFQALREEIDRISGTTSFNSINLLDGTLSESNYVTPARSEATAATGSLTFTSNLVAGETVVLNGVTLTAGTDFAVGGSIDVTVSNIATAINSSTSTSLSGVTAGAATNTLTLTADAGGAQGNNFVIDEAASTGAAKFSVSGASTNAANVFTLQGGTNDGIYGGSTRATGSVGDTLLTAQSQTAGSTRLSVSSTPLAGETLSIDNGNGGTVNFTFVAGTPASSTEIQIGSSIEETMQNAVETINEYTNTSVAGDTYGLRQIEVTQDGTDLVFTSRQAGNPSDLTGANLDVSETLTGATFSAATISNGTTTGVDTRGVTEAGFTGTISGFTATYNSADNITASITVGDTTYTATISDTTPGVNTTVRFSNSSGGGGYFDVQLAAGTGTSVASQGDADVYASRLDAAFSTLSFDQQRPITSYSGEGSLVGSSVELRTDDFSTINVGSVSVTAPSTSSDSARIEVVINGQTYRSASNMGQSIGAYESIEFTNISNANEVFTFRNGATEIDLSTSADAAAFESDFEQSLGLNDTGEPYSLSLTGNDDAISTSIGSLTSDRIFLGASLNIANTTDAAAAQSAIESALEYVQGVMADIGSAQSRLGYAQDALENQASEIDIARAALEDTDIAAESIALALASVQAQSAIAVIAQTRNMASSMLDLVKNN